LVTLTDSLREFDHVTVFPGNWTRSLLHSA